VSKVQWSLHLTQPMSRNLDIVYVAQKIVQQNIHVLQVGANMEIGFFGGTILCIIMASMVFVGLHINKPFPWEDKDDS
jgi:hypothetical protein